MIECPHCGNQTKQKPKIKPVSYSPLSLSQEILIENARHFSCKKCLKPWVEIGDVHEIDLEIASMLFDHPELNRKHARFIRQHLLKISVFELAVRFGVPPIHLVDIENYRKIMSKDLVERYRTILMDYILECKLVIENGNDQVTLKIF